MLRAASLAFAVLQEGLRGREIVDSIHSGKRSQFRKALATSLNSLLNALEGSLVMSRLENQLVERFEAFLRSGTQA